MATQAQIINAYARKMDALRRDAVALPNEVRLAINAVTEAHRLRIKDMIEVRIQDGALQTAEYLPLQAQIEAEVTSMIQEAQALLKDEQEKAFQLATNKARELVIEAGGAFYAPSTSQLFVAQKFSADLITGLAAETMTKVNAVLSSAALGGVRPYEAMKQVDNILGIKGASGVSARAETIVRTEVHRIYSVALDAQFQSFITLPGMNPKKVMKRWVSGPYRAGRREDHQEMDGVEVPYEEPFRMPSGNLLMFPGDPGGAAEDVINCGCTWIVSPDSIEDAVLDAIENL